MRTIKLTFKTYFSFTVLVASSCDSKTTTTLPTIIPQNDQKNNDQSGSIHIEGPNAMVFCGDKNMIYKGPAREEDETDKPSPSGDRLTLSNKNCINKPLNVTIKSTEPGALIVVGSGNVIHMIQEQAPEEEPEPDPANTRGTDGKQGGKPGTNDEDSSTNGSGSQDDPNSATGKTSNEEEDATKKTSGEGTSSAG